MWTIFRLLFTLLVIVVTAIGFQRAFGVSGLWTIPVVIAIGFLPFGKFFKCILLVMGLWYCYSYGVDMQEVKRMFDLRQ